MKKIGLLFFTFFLIHGAGQNSFAQDYGIRLTIFEPLPEINFAAFAMDNNLSGAPTIMSIEITTPTPNEKVILEGKIEWKRDENDGFNQLYWFRTRSFSATNISNNDLGSIAPLADNQVNSSLTQENINKGKPTGVYKITVILRNEFGALKDSDQKEISFLNPAQTLTIRSPETGSSQNIGNVIAEWDAVIGAQSYSVRANVRTQTTQSLEDALNSGNPLINDKNVGNVNITSLREHLSREWLAGQEIVLRVTANIAGPSGGSRTLNSNIVNFTIQGGASEISAVNQEIVDVLQLLSDITGNDLVTRFNEGNIDFSNMRIMTDDGRIISTIELKEILNFLKTNPDNIVGVSFVNK